MAMISLVAPSRPHTVTVDIVPRPWSAARFPSRIQWIAASGHKNWFSVNRPMQISNIDRRVHCKSDINMEKEMATNFQSPPPVSHQPSCLNWGSWFFGWMFSLIIPFWKKPLARIEDEVEMVIDVVDNVAEAVEKVANVVDKVASDVADGLHEGKLKVAVLNVENLAKEVAKDAHIADNFLDKVDELREEIENLLEPSHHEGSRTEKGTS